MAIFLDEQPTTLAGQTLREILRSAGERLAPSGRIVIEVAIDGQSLDNAELQGRLDAPVSGVVVRLTSVEPRELASDALGQVCERLDDARQAQFQAAELLQQDRSIDAMRRISDAIAAWQQTQAAVLQCSQLLNLNLDNEQLDGRPVSAMVNDLLEQLKQLKTLINDNDSVGLADALAYEWPQSVDRWQRLAEHMIRGLARK
jgi:hypothetical protein